MAAHVYLFRGPRLGHVESTGYVFDAQRRLVGLVGLDGRVFGATSEVAGMVDRRGHIFDIYRQPIGVVMDDGAVADWQGRHVGSVTPIAERNLMAGAALLLLPLVPWRP
jgi:hypothetical protein